jgi:hypothetical protein
MKNEKVFLEVAIAPNHRRDPGGADGRQTRTAFAFLTSSGVRAGFPKSRDPKETQKKPQELRGFIRKRMYSQAASLVTREAEDSRGGALTTRI